FPVSPDRVVFDVTDLGAVQAMRPSLPLDRPAGRPEIGRLIRQADKDQPLDDLDMSLVQRVVAAPGNVPHEPRGRQVAVALVDPLMVGPNQLGCMTRTRLANLRAAVPAGIEEGANDAVIAADHDERVPADLKREIIARVRHLATVPGEQPTAVEDSL